MKNNCGIIKHSKLLLGYKDTKVNNDGDIICKKCGKKIKRLMKRKKYYSKLIESNNENKQPYVTCYTYEGWSIHNTMQLIHRWSNITVLHYLVDKDMNEIEEYGFFNIIETALKRSIFSASSDIDAYVYKSKYSLKHDRITRNIPYPYMQELPIIPGKLYTLSNCKKRYGYLKDKFNKVKDIYTILIISNNRYNESLLWQKTHKRKFNITFLCGQGY